MNYKNALPRLISVQELSNMLFELAVSHAYLLLANTGCILCSKVEAISTSSPPSRTEVTAFCWKYAANACSTAMGEVRGLGQTIRYETVWVLARVLSHIIIYRGYCLLGSSIPTYTYHFLCESGLWPHGETLPNLLRSDTSCDR